MVKGSAKVVMPIITVGSVDDAHALYTDKLGFSRVTGALGEDGKLTFATVVLSGARIMFARGRATTDEPLPAAGKRPVEIYLEVADIDAYHAQLTERSVKISEPLTLQWWGDRTFKVMDPHGYELWFFQKVGNPSLRRA